MTMMRSRVYSLGRKMGVSNKNSVIEHASSLNKSGLWQTCFVLVSSAMVDAGFSISREPPAATNMNEVSKSL